MYQGREEDAGQPFSVPGINTERAQFQMKQPVDEPDQPDQGVKAESGQCGAAQSRVSWRMDSVSIIRGCVGYR